MIKSGRQWRLAVPPSPGQDSRTSPVQALTRQADSVVSFLTGVFDSPKSGTHISQEMGQVVRQASQLMGSRKLSSLERLQVAEAVVQLSDAARQNGPIVGLTDYIVPRQMLRRLGNLAQEATAQALRALREQPPSRAEGTSPSDDASIVNIDRRRASLIDLLSAHQQQDTLGTLVEEPSASYALQRQAGPSSNVQLQVPANKWRNFAQKFEQVGRNFAVRLTEDGHKITPYRYEPARAVKTKRSAVEYRDQPFATHDNSTRYSKLFRTDGTYYVLTWTQIQGSFGKLRHGFSPDGKEFAIKEIRHDYKPGSTRWGHRKTHPLERKEAIDEATKTKDIRAIIDKYTSKWDNRPFYKSESFKKLRSGTQPFVLQDIIEDDTPGKRKTYLVMNKELGDVFDLQGALNDTERAAASLSLAAQGFTELAGLHDLARYRHGDLKLENLLFNELGQIKIMDWGMAEKTDKHGATDSSGPQGTLATPESIGFYGIRGQLADLTVAADVFCMGAMVAELAQSSRNHHLQPFFLRERLPGYDQGQRGLFSSHKENFAQFEAWKTALSGPNGRVDVSRIGSAPNNRFDQFFSRLAQDNPKLADLIINDAMHLEPQKRMSADKLAQHARELIKADDGQLEMLKARMHSLGKESKTKSFKAGALAYDVWDKQQTELELAQSQARRGQPRPLPR